MGCHCSQSKDFEQEEESLITYYEHTLGFSSHSAQHICTQVQILTVNERLNWNRLRHLAWKLDLNISGIQSTEQPIGQFYAQLKQDTDWSARQLCLLGILLGQGSVSVKASLLFNLYDLEYVGVLPPTRISSILQDLCALAFTHLPQFALSMLEHSQDSVKSDLLTRYAGRLAAARYSAATFLSHILVEEQPISAEEFISKAQTKTKYLFSARQLRIEGSEHYKRSLISMHRQPPGRTV